MLSLSSPYTHLHYLFCCSELPFALGKFLSILWEHKQITCPFG